MSNNSSQGFFSSGMLLYVTGKYNTSRHFNGT